MRLLSAAVEWARRRLEVVIKTLHATPDHAWRLSRVYFTSQDDLKPIRVILLLHVVMATIFVLVAIVVHAIINVLSILLVSCWRCDADSTSMRAVGATWEWVWLWE